ncbi:MAG TPA: HPr family phosphocarrier protein [Feifaniaceae bacterium]|nr:HPr family phosphocarrier protein [Feifaniaceae bacterium]
MKQLKYRITDEFGLHARPAGQLVKAMAQFQSGVKIGTPAKMVDAKRILGVMGLAVRHGDEIIMEFQGEDEAEAYAMAEKTLRECL